MKGFGYRLEGSPEKGVLLVHGLTGAPGEMRFLAKRLNARGFTVSVPELAGHGTERDQLLKTNWRDWYASLERNYDQFQQDVEQVYVAGICVGGALGLKLASVRAAVKGVAVYSMTFEYDGWNMARWASAAPLIQLVADLPGVRRIGFEEPYPFGIKDERLRKRVAAGQMNVEGASSRLPLGSLYQMYRLGRHIERIGAEIRLPTLILHAREDDMSSKDNALRLARCLGGPVELQFLNDSYHMIHVDKERERVAERTARFFGPPRIQQPATEPQRIRARA